MERDRSEACRAYDLARGPEGDAARIPMTDEAVLALLRQHFTGVDSMYLCPNIPGKKEIVARGVHARHLPSDERVLALFDDTVFGAGDEGFLVTSRRLCWKKPADTSPADARVATPRSRRDVRRPQKARPRCRRDRDRAVTSRRSKRSRRRSTSSPSPRVHPRRHRARQVAAEDLRHAAHVPTFPRAAAARVRGRTALRSQASDRRREREGDGAAAPRGHVRVVRDPRELAAQPEIRVLALPHAAPLEHAPVRALRRAAEPSGLAT